MTNADTTEENLQPSNRPGFQISLSTMLLMVVVFSVISAGIYHGSRIPLINAEIESYFGNAGTLSGSSRKLQIIFIMFTYSMPLIMAGVLSTMAAVWRRFNRQR